MLEPVTQSDQERWHLSDIAAVASKSQRNKEEKATMLFQVNNKKLFDSKS